MTPEPSVVTASSSASNATPAPLPSTPPAPRSKSIKALKDQTPKSIISSIRRSSSVKKVTEKYGSLKAHAVSKGIIQKSKKKVKKKTISEAETSTDSHVGDKDTTPVNEEASSKYEEETYFNVEFDSLPAGMEAPVDNVSTAGTSMKEDATTIVLLLLDGRRFELLQLEMSPTTAVVQDILNQIPIESTDKALRNQTYNSVCDRNGVELDRKKLVADYYPFNREFYYVAMAIPDSMSREEVLKFSKPIFSDTNISTMFKGSMKEGTSTAYSVTEPKEEITKDTTVTNEVESKGAVAKKDEETVSAPEEEATPKTAEPRVKKENEPSTPPVTTPKEISPPQSAPKRKDAGAAPKAATSIKKEMKKIFGNPRGKKKPDKKIEPKKTDALEQDSKQKQTISVPEKQTSTVVAAGSISEKIKPPSKSQSSSSFMFSMFVVFFSMIPIFVMLAHEQLYSPLAPSQELKVGQWRSSSGLFRFIPKSYSHYNSILLKMEEGGSLALMDENTGTMYWEMRSYADCEEGCGAVMTEAGIIEIGGEAAALVTDSKIAIPRFSAPWPFVNDQVVSTWPFSTSINMTPKRKKKKNRGKK